MQGRIQDFEIFITDEKIEQTDPNRDEGNPPIVKIITKIGWNPSNESTISHLIIDSDVRIKRVLIFCSLKSSQHFNFYGC